MFKYVLQCMEWCHYCHGHVDGGVRGQGSHPIVGGGGGGGGVLYSIPHKDGTRQRVGIKVCVCVGGGGGSWREIV